MPARLKTGLTREFKIDREKADREKRTIELAFSSEEPVERWGENEVLSHQKGDYDFSRLNDSHPLLLGHAEHDPHSQIGVIESARVDSDSVGRAIVRFGNSALADEIFTDVIDGIRQLISVGYDRTGIVESKKAQDGRVTTRYRWQPTHIAIVPVPADTTVGVGRNRMKKRLCPDCDGDGDCDECDGTGMDGDENCEHCEGSGRCRDCKGTGYITTAKAKQVDSPDKTNADKAQKFMPPEPAVAQLDETKIRTDERTKTAKETTESERARVKEIITIADTIIKDHGDKNGGKLREEVRAAAIDAIQKGEAVEKFQIRIMEDVMKAKPAVPVLLEDLTDEAGQRNYSILRAIQSCHSQNGGRGGTIPEGLEGEVHQEIMRRSKSQIGGLGYDAQGFQVPANAPMRLGSSNDPRNRRLARDMQATVFAQGGAFVPTQLVVPVIEILRNRMILDRVGKRTMAGLQGNIVIPRQEAAATAYSVGEIALLTDSGQVLGQISMTPHRVGATQTYSKQFVMQSTPDAEAFLRDDLFKVIAIDWDRLGLNGQGAASEPLGIFNQPGIGAVTFAATPTYIKIVAMETAIRALNVVDPLAYISTPTVKGALKTVAEALTGATTIGGRQNALWKGEGMDGEMNGYPAHDTNQVPGNLVLLGAFEHLIHAIWGGLDVVVDVFTKAKNAETVITINTWGDYAVRHPQAFCASTDAGNQ